VSAEEHRQHNALHDELTGLANRRHLIEHLRHRLSAGDDWPLAVVLLDLDRFKATNDTLGHAVGDRLLRQVASRLTATSRPQDLVARLGGDEFVVVPDGPTTHPEALSLAKRISERLGETLQLAGHHLSRTASIGVAVVEGGTVTAEELIALADVALRAAKSGGGNEIQVFDDRMRSSVKDRSDIEFELRDAIDTDAILVHYQPEFDLLTGDFLGVEALVRWSHPTRGLLDASAFIGVAEETNLVIDLGRKVLSQACRQMALWKPYWAGSSFVVRVNVSPAQLVSREIVDLVRFSLITNGLPGEALCLEVTEHAMMTNIETSLGILQELRSLGVGVAIDDFGTGFSSLAQLKRLPVTALKIDRAFVTDLDSDPSNTAIVQSMIQLAGAFNLEVIVEGIETHHEARALLKLGARRVQGYLFSRAKAPEAVVEYFGHKTSTRYQLVG
jgi:diguanylate cyclase (GGDEF)-like protein